MRVLFLTPYLSWPLDHGGRIRSYHLLRGLVEQGAQVVNVTGLGVRDDSEAQEALKDQLRITIHGTPLNPPFGRLGMGDRFAKRARLLLGRSSLLARFRDPRLGELVRQFATTSDRVVFDHVWMTVYRPEVPNRPFILSTHNVESAVIRSKAGPGGGDPWTRREVRHLERAEAEAAGASRGVIVVSEEDARAYRGWAPESPITVIQNGVDLASTPLLKAPPAPPRFFYVGGYDYHPNLLAAGRILTSIFPKLRERIPDAELCLVGDDPSNALPPMPSGATHWGRVKSLQPCFEGGFALLAPIPYGGGSRIKVLESLAHGRPVIATREALSGLDLRPGRDALVAESDDEFATACHRLVTDPVLWQELSDNGRKFVQEYDWRTLRERAALAMMR